MRLLAGSPTSAHPRELGQKSVLSHGEGTRGEIGMGEMLLSSAASQLQECVITSKSASQKVKMKDESFE